MKKFIATLALSSLLLTLAFGVPTFAADTEEGIDMTVVMATNSDEYDESDSIYALINLENKGDEDLTITFDSSCYFTMAITTIPDNSGDYDIMSIQNEDCENEDNEIILEEDGNSYVYSNYLWFDNVDPGEYRLFIEVAEGKVEGDRGYTSYLEDYEEIITITSGIDVEVDTDKNSYEHDDVVMATITINNDRGSTFSYEHNCNEPPFRVYEENGDLIFDSEDDQQSCGGRITKIEPFDDYEETFTVYDPEDLGPLEPGESYELEVDLDDGITASTTFEIEPLPVESVDLSISLSDIHYRTTDEIIIDWAATNEGDQTYQKNDLGCSPFVELYHADTEVLVYSEQDDPSLECESKLGIALGPGATYYGTKVFDLNEHKDKLIPGDYYVYVQLFDGSDSPDTMSREFEIFTNEIEMSSPFEDIYDHWAAGYIIELRDDKVVQGYEDHTYRPDRSITRAEFLVMIMRAFDLHTDDLDPFGGRTFSDVAPSDWFYSEVEFASLSGIIDGYQDGTFQPYQTISRAEAMSVLLRTLDEVDESATQSIFWDVGTGWQTPYVMSAYNLGLVNGYRDYYGNLTGEFRPNEKLTRAEAAKTVLLASGYSD